MAHRALFVAVRGVIATCLLLAILLAVLVATILVQAERHEARRVDAILVIGTAQHDGIPSSAFRAHLDTALILYRRGFAPRLMLVGSSLSDKDPLEVETARDYLIKQGVDPTALLIEEQGRSISSSLRAAAQVAQPDDIESILLISDAYHTLRILKIARDYGFEAYAEPVSESIPESAFARAQILIHEAWAYLFYTLFGR